jgi:exodeoxyribonuclease V alpha subunit
MARFAKHTGYHRHGPRPAQRIPLPLSAAGENEIFGLVEHVTFHNEETGFAVLRVKARGHRDPVTVTGTLPHVTPGEWIEAAGQWMVDPKHGPQFKADTIKTSQPDTLEGIEKYLGSGLIRGIGPVYARKLVQKFGAAVFDVIERQSALLEKVEGIGPTRRASIKQAWDEQKAVREIMSFLFSHGVTTSRAFRIYKTYGNAAIEKIRLDPYCLARDIHGIGFQTADKIAERLGVARDSDLRARAGVEYILNEMTEEGHCAYGEQDLINEVEHILDIPPETIRRAVDFLMAEQRIVRCDVEGKTDCVALAHMDYKERKLAERLRQLAGAPAPPCVHDLLKAVAWAENAIGLTLDQTQRDALRMALSEKVCVITGGPGVGKTTLIRALLKVFGAVRQRVVLCAPTGRAAKRIMETTGAEAKTIHRLLHYDPSTQQFKHDSKHPLAGDVFIVDEASMIDLPLAYHLINAIPLHARLVWVGDVDQLPSVGPGCVLHDLIASSTVSVARLTHIFRQAAQSAIVRNAHRVNSGEMPEYPSSKAERKPDHDFFFIVASDAAKATDLIVQLVTKSLPDKFGFHPINDIQVLSPMQRGELGVRNLNVRLQQALNGTAETVERFGWRYGVGDKVMQLENDYDKDVFNGDIGRIVGLCSEERSLQVQFDDRVVEYDLLELDELALSYAITIHKSQGSEYPCVVIPLHTQHFIMLERHLLYTAITRGRKLVVVIGSPKALQIAVQRAGLRNRVTALRERLIQAWR